jgi:error-prone DNA polymerase
VLRAKELGYRALAITDHDGLHGAMAFAQACKAQSIQPIVGVELTLSHGLVDTEQGPFHLTLLAENARGYANLCRLITEAHRDTRTWPSEPEWAHTRPRPVEADRAPTTAADRFRDALKAMSQKGAGAAADVSPPSLHPDLLAAHAEGLIALTGCRSGEVSQLVDQGRLAEARQMLQRLCDIFGPDQLYVELQHNLVKGDTRRVACLAQLASELSLPVVATGNVHYHERARHRLHDALVAVKHRSTLESSHRLRRANSEFYLREREQVAAIFAGYAEALANTEIIARRCKGFNLAEREFPYEFPDFVRREGERKSSAEEVLRTHCHRKFLERYPRASTSLDTRFKAWKQLHEELNLVARHQLTGFFLIYRDIQQLAIEVAQDVRGPGTVRSAAGLPPGRGRGSSVSSIICYLIGLSHVDPVKHKLFFHRFLNEDLKSVPDIDLDFARDIREELILRVLEKYGYQHAALVCTFATYHLRSAVRDLGKVLGLPAAAIDKLARLSDSHRAGSVRREMEYLPEFEGRAGGPLWSHLIDLAQQIDGFPRHVGQHVGGIIISSKPLVDLVPVQPTAMPGRAICQWDKDSCDDARFIKIDFLGLGMLSLVEECLELICQTRGEKFEMNGIDYEKKAIYDSICTGDTVGLFQIESRAQIQMLPRTQPRTLDDLAVQVAIVRPGPIVGGAVNPYVTNREKVRNGLAPKVMADHPLLEELLKDTLGIVLYQDQVLEVASLIGGFTPGQADQFRRAMSRRRSLEAMERFREPFMRGARRHKTFPVSPEVATKIFDKLCGFSEFGFPKSHAYAFAFLAYQSAWLRYYYPAEYYCALLNNQPMGFYQSHVLIGDAKRHKLRTLRVAINTSRAKTYPVTDGVRSIPTMLLLGLTTVKGLSDDLAGAIVEERTAGGPYRSLSDLLQRVDLPRPVIERLIAVGALSDFGLGRRDLLWQLGLLRGWGLASAAWQKKRPRKRPGAPEQMDGQSEMMSEQSRPRRRQLAFALPVEQDMVELQDMDEWERMVAEYGLLGLSPSYHPLRLLRPGLPTDLLTAEKLKEAPDGQAARAAGLVVCRQHPGTAKGFVFLLIEDETGLVNVVIRPALYERDRSLIRGEMYLCVEGTVQQRSGTLNLIAERIAPLSRVPGVLLPGGHSSAAISPAVHPVPSEAQLPQPPLRHGYSGNLHDPREAAPEPPVFQRLRQATPPGHDFH